MKEQNKIKSHKNYSAITDYTARAEREENSKGEGFSIHQVILFSLFISKSFKITWMFKLIYYMDI